MGFFSRKQKASAEDIGQHLAKMIAENAIKGPSSMGGRLREIDPSFGTDDSRYVLELLVIGFFPIDILIHDVYGRQGPNVSRAIKESLLSFINSSHSKMNVPHVEAGWWDSFLTERFEEYSMALAAGGARGITSYSAKATENLGGGFHPGVGLVLASTLSNTLKHMRPGIAAYEIDVPKPRSIRRTPEELHRLQTFGLVSNLTSSGPELRTRAVTELSSPSPSQERINQLLGAMGGADKVAALYATAITRHLHPQCINMASLLGTASPQVSGLAAASLADSNDVAKAAAEVHREVLRTFRTSLREVSREPHAIVREWLAAADKYFPY